MASNWNRLKYDQCNYNQEIKVSTEPGMYGVYLDRYENELGVDPKVQVCNDDLQKTLGCRLCDENKNAKYNNDNKTYVNSLVDIEADLRQYTRLNSRCVDNKYKPNNLDCVGGNNELCNVDNAVFTPLLCDRLIVPTNMVRPTNSGLKYF